MKTTAPAISTGSLKQRAISLTLVNAVDYVLQLLLPVVLVRYLDTTGFGEYRTFWLIANSVMAIAPLGMPRGLFYFLPRASDAERRLYIHQTMLFLCVAGIVAALLADAFGSSLLSTLTANSWERWILPSFIVLWVVASLVDTLPTVEERIRWQAMAIVALAVSRTACVVAVAVLTHDVRRVFLALLFFTVFKTVLLLAYVNMFHGFGGPVVRKGALADQIKHSTPFGFAGALYGMRVQADQWVVVTMFSTAQFAAFSIASVLAGPINLLRQSVNNVLLPRMSRLHAAGDMRGMLALNARANVATSFLAYPALCFAFFFAEPLITLVYTSTYREAAGVFRVYIVGLLGLALEFGSVLVLLKQGNYAVRVNFLCMICSAVASYLGAHFYGLPGAALGSVGSVYLEAAANLWRASRISGVSLRQTQDWKALGMILLAAVLASSCAAWFVNFIFAADGNVVVKLLLGGAVNGMLYFVLARRYDNGAWFKSVSNSF